MIKLDASKCPKNHPCILLRLCPKKAITQDNKGLPKIDYHKCIECGTCVNNCSFGVFKKSE